MQDVSCINYMVQVLLSQIACGNGKVEPYTTWTTCVAIRQNEKHTPVCESIQDVCVKYDMTELSSLFMDTDEQILTITCMPWATEHQVSIDWWDFCGISCSTYFKKYIFILPNGFIV